MVRVFCHGHYKDLRLHHTLGGRSFVMVRKKGGGVKRKYIKKRKRR